MRSAKDKSAKRGGTPRCAKRRGSVGKGRRERQGRSQEDKGQDATRDAEVLERGDKKDKDEDKKDGAKKRGQNRESRTEKNAFEF